MKVREIRREEIKEIRELDRCEIVEQIYYYQNGNIVLKDEYYEIKGWIPEELEEHIKDLSDLYDQGGFFIGAFINHKLVLEVEIATVKNEKRRGYSLFYLFIVGPRKKAVLL